MSMPPVNTYHIQHEGERDAEKNRDFSITLQKRTFFMRGGWEFTSRYFTLKWKSKRTCKIVGVAPLEQSVS